MRNSYYAKIEDIRDLHRFSSDHVRWLNPAADFEMIREYFSYFNVYNETDTYFGISLKNIKTSYSIDTYNTGHLCGYVKNGRLLSLAGVEFCSPTEWEISAVSTHPDHTGNGYAKAVCSFVAEYILEHNHTAICETNPANFAMQAVMTQIGMQQYCPQHG